MSAGPFTCQASVHASSNRVASCQSIVIQEAETIVKASLTTPEENRGAIRMVIGITQDHPEKRARSLSQERPDSDGGERDVGRIRPLPGMKTRMAFSLNWRTSLSPQSKPLCGGLTTRR